MSGQRHAPAALPRERPGTHCVGGWVGPTAVWTGAENLAPHWHSIPWPASTYTDYAISTLILENGHIFLQPRFRGKQRFLKQFKAENPTYFPQITH